MRSVNLPGAGTPKLKANFKGQTRHPIGEHKGKNLFLYGTNFNNFALNLIFLDQLMPAQAELASR
jgi:hypothetical protein